MQHYEWYIYRTTNLINNKTYIGQHRIVADTQEAKEYLGSGTAILSALKKYGAQNFKKEILINHIQTKEEANKLEVEHIIKEKELGKGEYNLVIHAYGSNFIPNEKFTRVHDADGKIITIAVKELDKYLAIGYTRGLPEKLKKIISNTESGKTLSQEEIEKRRQKIIGNAWYHNNEIEVWTKNPPDGFIKGRLPGSMAEPWNKGKKYKRTQLQNEISKLAYQLLSELWRKEKELGNFTGSYHDYRKLYLADCFKKAKQTLGENK